MAVGNTRVNPDSDNMPASAGRRDQIRYVRSVGLPDAIALGSSIAVGVGVFVVFGQLLKYSSAPAVAVAYLLAAVAALPIILTVIERTAYLPITDGLYGLSRQSPLLALPYFTGWAMFGGLAALTAVLGWGLSVYAELLLRMFAQQELPPLPWLEVLVTAAGVGMVLLRGRWNWQRYTVLILASIAFVPLLTFRGLLALDPLFESGSTTTIDLLDVTVAIAASFWGIHFVMNVRNEMHRPTRTLARALLANMGLRTVLGAGAALLMLWYPGDPLTTDAPLNDIAFIPGIELSALWQTVYGLFGLAICIYALRHTIGRAMDLTMALRRDGYLPADGLLPGQAARIDLMYLLFWILSVAGVALLSVGMLIELAAAGFLLSVALALLPSLRPSNQYLPPNRRLKLPFHPLFPALSIAVAFLLLLLTLDTAGYVELGWVALGLAAYTLNARSRAMGIRRENVIVEDDSGSSILSVDAEQEHFRVLVTVDEPTAIPNLILAAASIAQARHGEVLVLKILSVPDYVSDTIERKSAERELKALQEHIDSAIQEKGVAGGVRISPMIRLSSAPVTGILDTVSEENASLLLAAWRGEVSEEHRTPDTMLNDLVRYSPCPVTILRGELPDAPLRLAIFSAGGPNASAAVPVAESISQSLGGSVALVTINSGMEENEAQSRLQQALAASSQSGSVEAHIANAGSVEAGVKTTATDADLILLGFSKEEVSTRSYFGGLAAELAQNSGKPSMLIRGVEHVRYVGVQRMINAFRDTLPNLTEQERTAVALRMRDSAIPSTDFFVLIVLASAIATLGLLQNSTAVIIGAMLVAPLMSPILATGMTMVMGESHTLRLAVESTAKGVFVAILVGIVVTVLSPITEATSEIMARTEPTLLDLMVALTSGAAAGYAICRKEVAAALPGVAISAALVPPLCVVGYGIGTSRLDIASGSLLLFTTNLIAIVVAGAVVFLALGFHPPSSERREFRRNLWVSAVSLAAVFVVLMIATLITVNDANARQAVERVFRQDMVAKAVTIDELYVDRRGGEYFVKATVFAYDDELLSSQDINRLQDDLGREVGGTVYVDLTIVPATGSDLVGAAQVRALREYLDTASSEANATVAEMTTEQRASDTKVLATLVVYPESTLSEALLDKWQTEMTDLVGQPVLLDVTIIEGVRGSFAPTATQAPSIVATTTPAP